LWLAGSVPITADAAHWNGNAGPGCLPHPAAGAVLNFRIHRSIRITIMFRGIAIALFGMGIFSQLDQAFFYGRHTDAAFKLAREIGRGFGLG
jgi:hypothetical protein